MKTETELFREWEAIDNDQARWAWLVTNQNEDNCPGLRFTNVSSFLEFDELGKTVHFNVSLKYVSGLNSLLYAMGITKWWYV